MSKVAQERLPRLGQGHRKVLRELLAPFVAPEEPAKLGR